MTSVETQDIIADTKHEEMTFLLRKNPWEKNKVQCASLYYCTFGQHHTITRS